MKDPKSINHLLLELEQGSQRALGEIMDIYTSDLLLYAFSFTKEKELAEEIVEDIFLNIWNTRESISKINNIKAYLVRSVRNKCLNELEKQSRKLHVVGDDNESENLSDFRTVEDDYISEEYTEFVNDCIDDLPERGKEILILARFNKLKYKEISKLLKISTKTVENTLSRTLKKLSKSISERKIKKSTKK